MATMGALSKVRGTSKAQPYPQTEGLLADTMQKYGTALGADSDLGKGLNWVYSHFTGFHIARFHFCFSIHISALIDASEAYRQLADIKYQMEDNVKHNFLDPLAHLQQTDLKEVNVCLLVFCDIYYPVLKCSFQSLASYQIIVSAPPNKT